MTTIDIILAILAERYPAAYADFSIHLRVKNSGLADEAVTRDTVRDALVRLVKLNYAEIFVDQLDGQEVYAATTEGKKQWILQGQAHIQ